MHEASIANSSAKGSAAADGCLENQPLANRLGCRVRQGVKFAFTAVNPTPIESESLSALVVLGA